jgi:hypothetical protein
VTDTTSPMSLRTTMALPTEPMGMGGIAWACDTAGNPVCPGCGCGGFTAAAFANGGSTRTCYCPIVWDPRITPVASLADAHELLAALADHLERSTTSHPATCDCAACEGLALLRRGTQ